MKRFFKENINLVARQIKLPIYATSIELNLSTFIIKNVCELIV